jgi:hypothetical protein
MLDYLLATSALSALSSDILKMSIKKIGKKYSVDSESIKYVINEKIQEEFRICINISIKAFLEFISEQLTSENKNLDKPQQEIVSDYLKSSEVTEEIWHLLDPGSEFFDKGYLTGLANDKMKNIFGESTLKIFFTAWEEFIKAFSFASRSSPDLREFLRASYEAGSFRTLTNIEDVLERMNRAIGEFKDEEVMVSQSIEQYTSELKAYRTWAASFQIN